MRNRRRRTTPALNTTSTADISFMLLIFFLVTTSMDTGKGLSRQLPPLDEQKERQVVDVDRRNVMQLKIDANNVLTVDDNVVQMKDLRRRVMDFVAHCPDRASHVLQIDADRHSSYDTYFQMQNEIVAAYRILRDLRARHVYGKPYTECGVQQQDVLREYYPQRIAETYHEKGVQP